MAALALARRFSERWSFNLASTRSLWPDDGELDQDYYGRLWSVYADVFRDRDVGADWASMSEGLHGRAMRLSGRDVSSDFHMQDADRMRLHSFIVRASEVVLRRARGAVRTAAIDSGEVETEDLAGLLLPVSALPKSVPAPGFLAVFF